MIGDPDNKLTYRVAYKCWYPKESEYGPRRSTTVYLYPGFTGLGDIPKIVAEHHGGGVTVTEVLIVATDLIGVTRGGVAF